MEPPPDITRLLEAACAGEAAAADALYRRLQADLRDLAARHMRDERVGHTLQPTAVIHEAWMRLFGGDREAARSPGGFDGRQHFLRTASRAMRQVLIDHARRRLADKRGGGRARQGATDLAGETSGDPAEILAVHEALEKLEATSPERAEVVQLRYFGGLELAAIADLLGVTERTVQRRWSFARAWLLRAMGGSAG